MFIGEERVPFNTCSIHFLLRPMYSPQKKYKMAAQLLWLNEIVESVFGRRECREFKKL